MKANETTVLKFIEGQKQFQIPIYQRDYKWTKKQCEDILFNIEEVINGEIDTHFLGSIVYIEDSIYASSILPKLFIIDGQQRTTTLKLLLLAIATKDEKGNLAGKIKDIYLTNKHETEGLNRYKLVLKTAEEKVYMKLIDNIELSDEEEKFLIVKNYKFFLKYLERKSQKYLTDIFNALNKILIIDVALDKNNDNPQRIFEMLNSTGLQLKTSDMIRNYILMNFDREKQDEVYHRYWEPLENNIGHDHLDNFFRDYLSSKFGKIVSKSTIFVDFKSFFKTALKKVDGDDEFIISDIYRYSQYYDWLINSKEMVLFRDLKTSETAFPFILTLRRDLDAGSIDEATMNKSIALVESYLFRRIVCEVPTTPLKKIFVALQSADELLTFQEGNERFPSDAEFTEYLEDDGFYSFYDTKFIKYSLSKLEEFYSGEKFSAEKFGVEYILPKCCITPEWKKTLGNKWQEKYKKFVNGLENVTLIDQYVPRNGSFETKLKIYKTSQFSINNYFIENEIVDFNDEELLKRRAKLVQDILKVW